MSPEDYFIVNLSEDKAKKLSQVMANETSRKIMDHLAKKKLTESEIAKALGLPLSTVHYNLKQMMDVSLVKADEYHYSPKGKMVNHYQLSSKLVVIAPMQSRVVSIKAKMASIVPAVLVSLVGTAVVYAVAKAKEGALFAAQSAPVAMKAAADTAAEEAAGGAGATRLMAAAPAAESVVTTPSVWQSAWPWFLIGALVAILAFLFFDWLRAKKE
jgi:DNA-binding transcriptional ArsR family regulator